MTITVSFENPPIIPQRLMSTMPSNKYFVARHDDTKRREICIKTGAGGWLFVDEDGYICWTHDTDWVDNSYTPLPNEHATVTISI